jgi:hypothetical protein
VPATPATPHGPTVKSEAAVSEAAVAKLTVIEVVKTIVIEVVKTIVIEAVRAAEPIYEED